MSSGRRNRPVLVTGGAGFIGSHLVDSLLQRGDGVIIVDTATQLNGSGASRRTMPGCEACALDLRHDDLRPLITASQPSAVLHLAGLPLVAESLKDARQDFEANALTTVNVLEAVRERAPDAKVILTSSAAVYGESAGVPFCEDHPTMPIAPYGLSKLVSEQYVTLYARVHGLRTASLRLFNVYGPRQRRHVIYDLMRRVSENPNELLIQGDGQQIRDFVHVADVVDAFLAVIRRAPLEGEVYNVGGDEPTSIAVLAKMICERMGVSPRFVYSGDVAAGVSLRWVADSARLRKLGYEPRVRLAKGLTEAVAWFRQTAAA